MVEVDDWFVGSSLPSSSIMTGAFVLSRQYWRAAGRSYRMPEEIYQKEVGCYLFFTPSYGLKLMPSHISCLWTLM